MNEHLKKARKVEARFTAQNEITVSCSYSISISKLIFYRHRKRRKTHGINLSFFNTTNSHILSNWINAFVGKIKFD